MDGLLFLVFLRTHNVVALISNISNSVSAKLKENNMYCNINKYKVYIIVMMVLAFLASIKRHKRISLSK